MYFGNKQMSDKPPLSGVDVDAAVAFFDLFVCFWQFDFEL
jgi:hypothetical protein